MADNQDDKQRANQEFVSFKERILAELEEAVRIRQKREEESYQDQLIQQEASLLAQQLEKKNSQSNVINTTASLEREFVHSQETEKQTLSETQETVSEKNIENNASDHVTFTTVANKEDEKNSPLENASFLDVTAGRTEVHQVLDNLERVFTPEIENESGGSSFVMKEEPLPSALETKQAVTDDFTSEAAVAESDVKELVESVGKRRTKKSVQRKRQRWDYLAKKLALYIISFTLIILLAFGGFGVYYVSSSLKPVNSKSTDYVQVEIPTGSGTKMIGQILEKKGLIRNATIFNYYSKFKNYSNYQSGYFNLQKSMSLDEIAKALQKEGTTSPTRPVLGKILIKEGDTIEQIAKAIEVNANSKKSSKTPYSASDFLKLMKNESFIKEMVEKYPKLLANLPSKEEAIYQLEGYLFPATYDYYKATNLKELVDSMLQTMDTALSDYYTTISDKGMTVNQVLTLASLVEKEGKTDEDRRMIASVFYNRLNAGQALQSNIAILYAMGKLGETTTLSEDANIDTSIDSPYNDYTHTGLMPGPVDSAGLSAIKAVLNPESTDYYYFVADVKTGKVYYANDYETHQKNVEKYVNSQISN
ncbi:endolytic transglycosylase MltG [Streptococcus sciuri]|uniref:Endolytic murein transglycosylase n=1 Tax=Streptococcus sciuri TaxID=2973939 RepID=A0ABT2FAH8_9STRE|nr:endolytic transglycosylase MltG [Streptococcus sciuri]MCS4488847.1 endolytic transglycosylase MltG [Streptococcus sciuri]